MSLRRRARERQRAGRVEEKGLGFPSYDGGRSMR